MSRSRTAALALGVPLGLVALILAAAWAYSSARLNRDYEIDPARLTVATPDPTDSAQVERGRRVAIMRACTHCHAEDFGGADVSDEMPPIGTIAGPNLTSAGLGPELEDRDWARAVRHAVGRDGEPLLFMPSGHVYVDMTDEEVGAMIAYARSLPGVDREMPETGLNPLGHVLLVLGGVAVDAERIDHSVEPYEWEGGVSVRDGEYLVEMCTPCHASDLGGMPPGSSPRPGPALTPDSPFGQWSEDDFVRFFETGETPFGRSLDPAGMPWKAFGLLREDEIRSLYRYLRTVPPSSRRAPGAATPAAGGADAAT